MNQKDNIAAIIPAAGKAKRLAPLPFSKELYPVGAGIKDPENRIQRVISSFLLESLVFAGITGIHFVIRPEKHDIMHYYKGGSDYNCNISYHVADYEYGVPYSVNQVYPFVKDRTVAFGFPDIYIKPVSIFRNLTEKFNEREKADVLLGLMPVADYRHWDMVETDKRNKVVALEMHSERGKGLKYGWSVAVWKPSFTAYLKHYIDGQLESFSPEELGRNEYSIGHVFQKAIGDGMNIYGEVFDEAVCIDAGTYEGVNRVMREIKKTEMTGSEQDYLWPGGIP